MKRSKHLFEQLPERDNLYLAFWKAQRGKRGKPEVEAYRQNLDDEIGELARQLRTGQVAVGDYYYFKIYDPKERVICASSFRERVLHHALMNVCHEAFERYQIYDSYACRPQKGTHRAVLRAFAFNKRHRYFAKLDVRKYFETLDHEKLKERLARRFADKPLLDIFDQIIDSYHVRVGKGVPIGNLTSQYFANHFLAAADHVVKDQMGVKAYVRYMDDMVLWADDKRDLLRQVSTFSAYLENELACQLKPLTLNETRRGLPFLGYTLSRQQIRLHPRSRKRFTRKYAQATQAYQRGETTQHTYAQQVQALLSFFQLAETEQFQSFSRSLFLKEAVPWLEPRPSGR